MSIEIIFGIAIILIVAVWAGIYINKRTKENNNEHLFDFIPHLFPTLGILFTFLGIAIGLWNFDSNDIEKSIPELMTGLKTAFLVSIFGVALLVCFSFWTNIKKKKLEEGVLSEETQAINKLIVAINELRNDLASTDENKNVAKAGNILRDIYNESIKQSNSLLTFSSDLALAVSAGFEQILNNPAEGVVAELKLVKAEIENLGNKLQDPATDMTQNIVKDLQEAMREMIKEFTTSVSGDTKKEMENLAHLLGQAGGSLTEFPTKLQNMTDSLNSNFIKLQEVIDKISRDTNAQSEESINKIKEQVDAIATTIGNQLGGLQKGQETLIKDQNTNIKISENLLNAFNVSIEKMHGLSVEVTQSINKLNQAQTELDKTVSTFRNVSQEINISSTKFGESQLTFTRYSQQFLDTNSNTILEIQKSLEKAKSVSVDYAHKFEIIEKGLQNIFIQINEGLKSYEQNVSENIQKYLSQFTTSLTETAKSLGGASQEHKEILYELSDLLDGIKKR